MPTRPIQFASQSYLDASKPVSVQRCRNLYPEPAPPDAKSQLVLRHTPGLKLWSAVGDGPIRGVHELNGYLWVVSGTKAYMVDAAKEVTEIGIVSGSGPVRFAASDSELAIVSSSNVYRCSTTEAAMWTPTGKVARDTTYLDGYHLFCEKGTEQIFFSGINDLTSFNALDVFNANAAPDELVALEEVNRQIVAFGRKTIEVWYDSGDADLPFRRSPGGLVQRGCASTHSVREYGGHVFWLGDDLQVYTLRGASPVVISTPAVAHAISGYGSPEDAVGMIYSQAGHVHYALSFVGDATWVYDISTARWHERVSQDLAHWRVNTYHYFDDKHLVGDVVNGNVYELDLATYTDNGDPIIREAVSPPIHAAGRRVAMGELWIDMETGVGLESGDGSDPQAMLDWTDDGGRSWSNEHWRDIGLQGLHEHEVRWQRLGSFRNSRSVRLKISDPVKVAILGAHAELEVGE